MPDYLKTVIYQIRCKDESIKEKYIGHTTNFIKRVQAHQSRYNIENNKGYYIKVYTFIRSNGGWDNWIIEIILEYPCNNKNEAETKEDEYIDMLEHLSLNIQRPNRTKKEWKIDNANHVSEYNKNYNQRPETKEKKKKYDALPSSKENKHSKYEERCEIIKERSNKKYHEGGEKERRQQDRLDNPEKYKELDRINYAKYKKPLTEDERVERNRKARENYAKRQALKNATTESLETP